MWTGEHEQWACEWWTMNLWASFHEQQGIFLPHQQKNHPFGLMFFLVGEIFDPCGWKIVPHCRWEKGWNWTQVLDIMDPSFRHFEV
jgi:hypothetical protein